MSVSDQSPILYRASTVEIEALGSFRDVDRACTAWLAKRGLAPRWKAFCWNPGNLAQTHNRKIVLEGGR